MVKKTIREYFDELPQSAEYMATVTKINQLKTVKGDELVKLFADAGITVNDENSHQRLYVSHDHAEIMGVDIYYRKEWDTDASDFDKYRFLINCPSFGSFDPFDKSCHAVRTYTVVGKIVNDDAFKNSLIDFFKKYTADYNALGAVIQAETDKKWEKARELRESDIEIDNDNIDVDVATMKYALIDKNNVESARHIYRNKPVTVLACGNSMLFDRESYTRMRDCKVVECRLLKKIPPTVKETPAAETTVA